MDGACGFSSKRRQGAVPLHPGRYGQWHPNPRVSGPNTESGLFLFHRVVPEPVTGLGCGEVLLQRPVKLGFDNLLG